jgi:glycyl-tRNA synthetase
LKNKEPLVAKAREVVALLRPHMHVFYDEAGAIGRRYRRQDEIGTPFCVTVDGQTMTDNTVTIRDRDTLLQERVASDRVRDIVAGRVAG